MLTGACRRCISDEYPVPKSSRAIRVPSAEIALSTVPAGERRVVHRRLRDLQGELGGVELMAAQRGGDLADEVRVRDLTG